MVTPAFHRDNILIAKSKKHHQIKDVFVFIQLVFFSYFMGKQFGTLISTGQAHELTSCSSSHPSYEEAFNSRVNSILETSKSPSSYTQFHYNAFIPYAFGIRYI